ncbi:MAG: class III signal peptide-containing protein [archaeon]
MFDKKGQGTIEYLVIIAIVVVIALVVVGLLLQIMGQGSGVGETSARSSWKSAQPWAITDWSASGTILTLVLQNSSAESMDFNQVRITGLTTFAGGNVKNIAPGAKLTTNFTLTIPTSCAVGTKYSYPKATIIIDYNSSTIVNKTQAGVADIVGTC